MKFKSLKSLKTDITGGVASLFKPSKFFRNTKTDLFFSLKKDIKNRKMKRGLVFKTKSLLSRLNPIISSSPNKKNLDFNSANSKNVFLRTKRKSSYGQTLLEKQRLKKFFPGSNEKEIKKLFHPSALGNTDKPVIRTDLPWNNYSFIFSSSGIFDSKEFIRNKNLHGDFFFRHPEHSIYSYRSDETAEQQQQKQQQGLKGLRLHLIKGGKGGLCVFDRVLPNNMVQDLRLHKIIFVEGESSGRLLPFEFDTKKIVQHYRLKRQ